MNTLLLIDDDADWLFIMRRSLSKMGFHVVTSMNGADLFKKINETHPDAILLDIQMNGISGEDICHDIKTDLTTHDIPLFMFSHNSNIEYVAKRCGADGFIPKSAPMEEVKEKLKPFMEIRN